MDPGKVRLVQIDGLRALAALAVVAFHYTTRFDELFVRQIPLTINAPHGYLGVNLFFAVSGFVIAMSLDASRRPTDFVVSRFARLFPAYWVAVVLTWSISHSLSLPGYDVSPKAAIANLSMIQGFFGVPSVDGVYWTLQIEIVFYLWMLAIWSAGLRGHIDKVLGVWILVAFGSAVYEEAAGGWIPWTIKEFALLRWIPWFAIGIVNYRCMQQGKWRAMDVWFIAAVLVAVAVSHGPLVGSFAAMTHGLLYFAARGRLQIFQASPLIYLGLISYPLYLIHEKIGWSVMLFVERFTTSGWLPVAVAVAVAVGIAAAIHHGIESPSRRLIRAWHVRRTAARAVLPSPSGTTAALAAIGVLTLFAVSATLTARSRTSDTSSSFSLETNRSTGAQIHCAEVQASGADFLLVLGQSNAASHQLDIRPTETLWVYQSGRCSEERDPLVGTTGSKASVWSAMSRLGRGSGRQFVFVPFAIGNTRISDWTGDTALRERFEEVLREVGATGVPIRAVLWQQGEADALAATEGRLYAQRLVELRDLLVAHGITAPLIAARSTVCGGNPYLPIRRAIANASRLRPAIIVGPDFDVLGDEYRYDQCHFNQLGRDEVARLWLTSIPPPSTATLGHKR